MPDPCRGLSLDIIMVCFASGLDSVSTLRRNTTNDFLTLVLWPRKGFVGIVLLPFVYRHSLATDNNETETRQLRHQH